MKISYKVWYFCSFCNSKVKNDTKLPDFYSSYIYTYFILAFIPLIVAISVYTVLYTYVCINVIEKCGSVTDHDFTSSGKWNENNVCYIDCICSYIIHYGDIIHQGCHQDTLIHLCVRVGM